MHYAKLLTAAAVGTVFAAGTAIAQDKSLTIVSWGGAYTASQVEAYHKPYAKKTGVKIKSEDYNGGIAQIKAQVKSGTTSRAGSPSENLPSPTRKWDSRRSKISPASA